MHAREWEGVGCLGLIIGGLGSSGVSTPLGPQLPTYTHAFDWICLLLYD